MEQLIKITEDNGNRAVSMKELYSFLEIKENWTDWTKRMLGYGFEKDIDYQAVSVFATHKKGIGGTNKKDYALTIDTAKEISMLQRTEKGKQARRYFIEMEKVATKQIEAPVSNKSVIDNKKRELLQIIKANLRRGDIAQTARENNIGFGTVNKVLNGEATSKRALDALYKKALENKNTILFGYQEMIDMLKN